MELFSLKKEAFGLDISDLSFKILKLKKKKNKILLENFGNFEIEPGIIEGGEIKNEKKLAEILKEGIKKTKLKTPYVVASLPEEKSFLQVIQMPPMSEEDLKSAILFEAENYIPLPVDQVYLDCEIVKPLFDHQKKLDVLLAACPKNIVNSYLKVLKEAKLKPIAFEIESQAIVRALIEKGKSLFPVLIVDLGATRTSFIIFAERSVRFTCSIPISSNLFTEIIAKNLKIPLKEAEELKRKYGLGEKIEFKFEDEKLLLERKRGGIFEILVPVLVDLAQQIKKYFDYYESHSLTTGLPKDGKKIRKVILSGGGANLKGLKEFLEIELKIPVEIGNPWINISEKEQMQKEESLAFVTAIGLAQRAIQ